MHSPPQLQLRDCTNLQLDGPVAIGYEPIATEPNPVATAWLHQLQLDWPVAIGRELIATGPDPVATRHELVVAARKPVATARLDQLQLGWERSLYKMHPGAL